MKRVRGPSRRFLIEMAKALLRAEHRNVAEHLAAGFLWAIYPTWFDTECRFAVERIAKESKRARKERGE